MTPPVIEERSHPGAPPRELTAEQWLRGRLRGRLSCVDDACEEITSSGHFAFFGSQRAWTLIDPAGFAAQLAALRADQPHLFDATVPDHWLGEY